MFDIKSVYRQASTHLPHRMHSTPAQVMLTAIGLQESGLKFRRQHRGGPARGLWQFEAGGGVKGVLNHRATRDLALRACDALGVEAKVPTVWQELEHSDELAAVFARLLLWTLPDRLPQPLSEYEEKAWAQYIKAWRPGKPHRERWKLNWAQAVYIHTSAERPKGVGLKDVEWLRETVEGVYMSLEQTLPSRFDGREGELDGMLDTYEERVVEAVTVLDGVVRHLDDLRIKLDLEKE